MDFLGDKNRIYDTTLVCTHCGKTFTAKGNINYQLKDEIINLWCPTCFKDRNDYWTHDKIIAVEQNAFCTILRCRLKNGDVVMFEPSLLDDKVGQAIKSGYPEQFVKDVLAEYKRYLIDKHNKSVVKIDYVESFDSMFLKATQGSGKETVINYRVGSSGVLYLSPADIVKADSDVMQTIYNKLQEDGKRLG